MKPENEAYLEWMQSKHSSDSYCSELVLSCRVKFTEQEETLDENGRSAIYHAQHEKICAKHHARLKKHLRVRCNS